MKNLNEIVEGKEGYSTDVKLSVEDLEKIRYLIKDHWLETIKKHSPENAKIFAEYGMQKYHELSHLIEHSKVWPKTVRCLPQNAVDEIRKMEFFKVLEDNYGKIEISDEDFIGREEIYWRIVRPNTNSDIGPLHADAWFWEVVQHKITPPDMKRVKLWMAVYCEPGLNGLKVVPNSHVKNWDYKAVLGTDGYIRPKINIKEEDLNDIKLLHTEPGNCVVFHDRLLHGGALNKGNYTRVSLEFTMFVKKER